MAVPDTARYYPHLFEHAAGAYSGATALAAAGATYVTLRKAAETVGLGADPRPLRRIVPAHPGDTYHLPLLLASGGDTRAARLLTETGFLPLL